MRGHHAAAPSLGPAPTQVAYGELDCSGRCYRTMTGVIVRGTANQRMVVVRQGDEYAAHCWNRFGTGKSVEEAIEALVRAIDTTTQRDDLIGGIQGAA